MRLALSFRRVGRLPAAMALVVGALFSCRQATQITVYLRGEGFRCQRSESEPGYAGTGVLARSQLTGAGDLDGPRADGGDDDCGGSQPLDLGSVVLVPQTGPGPVEVLAIAALTPIEGAGPTTDECVGFYRDFLDGKTNGCAPDAPCAACIFARRSLGFVEYSNLDLTITLDNECAGVLCEASKTCVPERGCVSAVVECTGDACEEPAGGAGAGGAGGADGGGGAPPGVEWRLLDVGGVPHDIVARSALVADQLQLETYVAAGDRMLRYVGRDLFEEIVGNLADSYLVVAAEPGGARVVALGSEGESTGPGFAPFGVPVSGFVDLDIAIRSGDPAPIIGIDRGPEQLCSFAGTSTNSLECGVALFSVNSGEDAQVLIVGGPAFGGLSAGLTLNQSMINPLSRDWSLWGHPVVGGMNGQVATGYAVQDELMIRRFWLEDATAPVGQSLPNLASGNPLGVTIDAVWGVERPGGVHLYAVGAIDGNGWLGRADVLDGAASFDGWTTLPIPTGIQTLRSVWVGPDPGLDDAPVILIAGTTQSNEGIVAITELGAL